MLDKKGVNMAFFKDKTKPKDEELLIKTPTAGSKISRCMAINGDVVSCESIVVDGRINGDIVCDKSVVISNGAIVVGKIKAKEVRVDGALEGPIEAEIIEIGKSAVTEGYMIAMSITISGRCDGDILAENTLIVEEGADVTTLEAKAKIVKVASTFRGDITATELLEINDTGLVDGNVNTKEYFSSSGSRVTGSIKRYVGYISNKSVQNSDKSIKSDENSRVIRRIK
jgi:cytoskeletal protein CcmA (bactofilin family)